MDQKSFESLPLAQRTALQQQLKDKGLYAGSLDGKYGPGTKAGFDQLQKLENEAADRERSQRLQEKALDIKATEAEAEAAERKAAAKAITDKAARQAEYNKQATSVPGMVAQSAATLGAPAVGTAVGLGFGKGINLAQDIAQKWRNQTLQGAAEDRVRGLTTREGAVKGTRLAGAMPYENPFLRVASRLAPHMGLGAIALGKGAEILSDQDENQPFYPRMADRAAGLGYIGLGSGLMKRGIQQAANPGISPDAQALSVINSTQLRRSGIAPASESVANRNTPLKPGFKAPPELSSYLNERLGFGDDTYTNIDKVYADYVKYAQGRGETPMPQAAFLRQLRDQGLSPSRMAGTNRLPVTLNPEETPAAPEAPKALEGPSKTTRTHSDRLTSAAKAARNAGIDVPAEIDIGKKAGAASFLGDVDWANVPKEVRSAVAKELGIKPGANFAGRIGTAIKNMASKRSSSGLVGPLAAAGLAYELTPKRAEAAPEGETPKSDNTEALTNAAITGGTAYGVGKILDKIPSVGRALGAAGRFAGKALGPELMLASPEAMHSGESMLGGLGLPSFQQRMADRSGISQVPERGDRGLLGRRDLNAAALQIPANAYSSIPEQSDLPPQGIGRANGGRIPYGPLHHAGGGRTDDIKATVPKGAYVINADTISALGQGNTLAGFKVAQHMFPPVGRQSAKGDHVPVVMAGGEFVVSPEQVAAIGNGDPRMGADILDKWMQGVRADYVDTLQALPGPAQ